MKWKIILITAVLIFIVGVIASYITYKQIVVKANPSANSGRVVTNPTATPTPDPLAAYSILLMGYGGGIHEGGKLTDSIMVVKVNPREEQITIISIPRDLWVPIPINGDETKHFKINAAYAIGNDDKKYPNKKIEFTGKAGGGELAKTVVSGVVGFKVDYFMALDFYGFVKIIDILGGIDVKVLNTFDDPMYPIENNIVDNCGKTNEEIKALMATMSGEKLEKEFSCRYENLHFEKGINHMDGQMALKFSRSRHSKEDGGDFNRAARQRLVLLAAKDKVMSLNFIPKIVPIIKTLADNLITDVGMERLNKFIEESEKISKYKISSVALTNLNVLKDGIEEKQYVLEPRIGVDNFEEIKQFINN